MSIVTIGKRLIPLEQIALVEPFEPSANPEFKPAKEFKSRVILLNRDSVLTEETPATFAAAHGLHAIESEGIAVSTALAFQVETFTAAGDFKPRKNYRTRIKWCDAHGNEQSKLLVMQPEQVIGELSGRRSNDKPAPRRSRGTAAAARRTRRAYARTP